MSIMSLVLTAAAGVGQLFSPGPGTLHRIPLKGPVAITVGVGDLLQLDYVYPIVAGRMPTDLRVDLVGEGLRGVIVVRARNLGPDGMPLIGTESLAAFLLAVGPGETQLKVTPLGVVDAKPVLVAVVVKPRARRLGKGWLGPWWGEGGR